MLDLEGGIIIATLFATMYECGDVGREVEVVSEHDRSKGAGYQRGEELVCCTRGVWKGRVEEEGGLRGDG